MPLQDMFKQTEREIVIYSFEVVNTKEKWFEVILYENGEIKDKKYDDIFFSIEDALECAERWAKKWL